MKSHQRTLLAVVVSTLTLAAGTAACSAPAEDEAADSRPATSAPAATGSTPAPEETEDVKPPADDSGSAGGTNAEPSAGSPVPGKNLPAACTNAETELKIAPVPSTDDDQLITLTNTGSRTCTALSGPQVGMVPVDDSYLDGVLSVLGEARWGSVVLRPGESAYSGLDNDLSGAVDDGSRPHMKTVTVDLAESFRTNPSGIHFFGKSRSLPVGDVFFWDTKVTAWQREAADAMAS